MSNESDHDAEVIPIIKPPQRRHHDLHGPLIVEDEDEDTQTTVHVIVSDLGEAGVFVHGAYRVSVDAEMAKEKVPMQDPSVVFNAHYRTTDVWEVVLDPDP